ncbi:hypothetical protein CIB95_07705 [Lottiidibacillus patelloidae]|uniref:Uncharacterized protein n=1 Tax=Lottiidibacillus patelloidae TaxID=2670334 RepID=A0A263BUU9_9BACI|nr:hypothetical protein [Lottiidibacillus patelloidae]OZM57338.1 hypothetical protein CIB95_07705 [Lottiidibacillus patelloidae]
MAKNEIGTAWYGRHVVVVVTCNPLKDTVVKLDHSVAAPIEPIQSTCSSTLGMYFSIGYSLLQATALTPYLIQYVFVK